MNVLQVQNVVKSYGAVCAVNNVSLSLNKGDNLAIIGESGCGKTTFAKMIMGLIKPDAGVIKAGDNNLQMVFQDPNQSLDPLWNVREILMEALWRNRSLLPGEIRQRIERILAAVGLSGQVLHRFPHEFSGGERQRIAIARALLAGPQVLILDEAVSALDTLVQKQVMDLLKELKEEFDLTYIFISHNLRLVRHFSDKMMVMYQGKIIEQGQVGSVLHSPVHPYTKALLQAAFNTQI